MKTPLLCAHLMSRAYNDLTLDDVRDLGMTWLDTVENGASYVALTGDGHRCFIIPRGTNDLKDLYWDLSFAKTDFPGGGRVHAGFYAAFKAVWVPLSKKLDQLDPRLPLIATGHSLGGSMVQQIAASWPLDEAHVFGCPRVGNREFVDRITCPGVRYEAHFDMVTGVPFRWGPAQAIFALAQRRAPTMFCQPWRQQTVNSWGHSSSGYLRPPCKKCAVLGSFSRHGPEPCPGLHKRNQRL